MPDLDLQGLWETTQREVALEGSNGCTLERLWKLVDLGGPAGGSGAPHYGENANNAGNQEAEDDPQDVVRVWLWRCGSGLWC